MTTHAAAQRRASGRRTVATCSDAQSETHARATIITQSSQCPPNVHIPTTVVRVRVCAWVRCGWVTGCACASVLTNEAFRPQTRPFKHTRAPARTRRQLRPRLRVLVEAPQVTQRDVVLANAAEHQQLVVLDERGSVAVPCRRNRRRRDDLDPRVVRVALTTHGH